MKVILQRCFWYLEKSEHKVVNLACFPAKEIELDFKLYSKIEEMMNIFACLKD